jgi:hypothetical protein
MSSCGDPRCGESRSGLVRRSGICATSRGSRTAHLHSIWHPPPETWLCICFDMLLIEKQHIVIRCRRKLAHRTSRGPNEPVGYPLLGEHVSHHTTFSGITMAYWHAIASSPCNVEYPTPLRSCDQGLLPLDKSEIRSIGFNKRFPVGVNRGLRMISYYSSTSDHRPRRTWNSHIFA